MNGLVDSRGNPLAGHALQKDKPKTIKPIVGDGFGQWAGRDSVYTSLPGGGVLQFDLSKLTLADFRAMRQHYQLGASLNVLSFILHQIDWSIESDNKEAAEFIEEDLRENWTRLIRGMSQAFWAGFSPLAVNYHNADNYVRISNFKDLVPEECRVNWKKVDGWAPAGKPKPQIYHYDGLYHVNSYIPPENTLWYPLLMENGDHYGRKLLQPAFPSWYFSNLIHLFANRYFERFGEPLPIGRARFDDEVDMGGGTYVNGKKAMEQVVTGIRNRAVAVLPSDRDPVTKEYDYDIEYLESQMRGADFERYLNRLDEEMSLSVFTPVLLFRTADVGSYNLGQAHLRIFQQMLNAIAGDMQYYLQNYLVDRLKELNFPGDKRTVKWVYRRQGQGEIDTYKELMVELVRQDRALPDLEELAAITGIEWTKAEEIATDPADPATSDDGKEQLQPDLKAARAIAAEAAARTAREYGKGNRIVCLSHRNKFHEALVAGGMGDIQAEEYARNVYAPINAWLTEVAEIDLPAEQVKSGLDRLLDDACQ